MVFSKFRIAVPAALFACLLAASFAAAQNRITIQNNSGDAFLGITMEDVTASNMSEYRLADEKGVIVRSVQEGSPAEEAALLENDVILEFAGQAVLSTRQFSRLVSETPAGRKVAINVSRDGKRINLSATIRARTDAYRIGQRMEPFQGGQIERFLEMLPNDPFTQRSPRSDSQGSQGGRQGAERSVSRPRLGVEVQPLTEQMAGFLGVPGQKGVLITSVNSGSVSDGKLKAGDVVVGVNDREVVSPADLTRFVTDASGEINVKVIRDKKQISVSISLPSNENERGGGYRL